jgi:hypothetical protein
LILGVLRRLGGRTRLALVTLVVLVGLACSPPAHEMVTAGSVVLYFVPGHFPQPLDALGDKIRIRHFEYPGPAGRTIPATLYSPESAGRHPGILLVHGWIPRGDRAPEVIKFGEAMARAGHAVLVPRLDPLVAGVVDANDVRAVVMAAQLMRTLPQVQPDRIAIFGVCLGATMALAAASQPDMPPLRNATLINAYYDIVELLQGVTTHTAYQDGKLVEWVPGPQVVHVVKVNARVLGRSQPDAQAPLDAIFANSDPTRVRALWEAVPAGARARLEVASPALWTRQVQTQVVLIQAVRDPVVPPGSLSQYVKDLGSRAITAGGHPNPLMNHNEFGFPALSWSTLTQVYGPGAWQISSLAYSAFATLDI